MYKKSYRLDLMYIISVVLLFAIQIAYGHSYIAYAAMMISLIFVSAYYFLKNIKKYPRFFTFVCVYNLLVPFFIGFFLGGFQDALMAGVSLLLPLVFASYHMDETKIESGCWIIAIGLIILNFLKPYIPVFEQMNMNSYSFLMFMGFTSVFILVQRGKNVKTILMLLMVLYVLSGSGSRNAFIIAIVIALLAVLPYKVLINAVAYRVIYVFSLMYQVFSDELMDFAEQNVILKAIFDNLVDPFFDKKWGLSNRADILVNVSESIWEQDFGRILFGNGIAFAHAHNGFYQAMYMYGIVGVVLILLMYFLVFEMGYQVMKKQNNTLIMGCVLGLCGILLIQGADVFLWGVKTCSVVPFLLVGIILRAYMEYKSRY